MLNEKVIYDQINSLKSSEVMPIYLHSQNSCVLIRLLSEEQNNKAIISSFQTQFDNQTIMSFNGKITSFFPQHSFYIEETDFLKSQTFARLLADLGEYELVESAPITTKAGSKRVEVRDVVSPRFVSEWMSSMLSGNSFSSNYPKAVVKKIRDEVAYKDAFLPFRRSGNELVIKILN